MYHCLATGHPDYKMAGIGFSLKLLQPHYDNSRNGWRTCAQVPVPETAANDKDLSTNFINLSIFKRVGLQIIIF